MGMANPEFVQFVCRHFHEQHTRLHPGYLGWDHVLPSYLFVVRDLDHHQFDVNRESGLTGGYQEPTKLRLILRDLRFRQLDHLQMHPLHLSRKGVELRF